MISKIVISISLFFSKLLPENPTRRMQKIPRKSKSFVALLFQEYDSSVKNKDTQIGGVCSYFYNYMTGHNQPRKYSHTTSEL